MNKNPASLAQVDTHNLDSVIKGLDAVINAASFSSNDQSKLMALVQQQSGSDDEELGAPAAAVYKTHSGSIFDVLEDMKEKAEGQLNDLRKAESTAQHNFNMLKQSLTDEIENDNKDMDEEKSLKAASEEQQATAEGDLAETKKELAKDRESLKTATTTCMSVAADHEATVKSRTEELNAIATAEKILKESTGGAVEQSYSLLQLQSRTDMKNAEVVTLVKKLAHQQHSAALAQLASRIKAVMAYGANDDVFAKVKGLISDMIAKLADEQASMDAIRAEEKAAYDKAKSELEAGIAGVQKALGVLRDYYEGGAALLQKAGGFDAFMQQPAPPKKHSAASGAGGSILDILEVCESDFTKNLADEETEESDAVAVYEKTTQDNKLATTMKSQDVKYKTKEYKGLDKSISELSAERDNTNTELSAVLEYYAKIKDRCVAKPETYEERKARREAEINGLKEALSILENEAAFVQRGRKGHKRGHFMAM